MDLSQRDEMMLAGDLGSGVRLAMELLMTLAKASKATCFVDIQGAHIDGCLYHGQAGTDFVRALKDGGARVAVPTTLNVSSLDLLHPDLYRGDASDAAAAKELMDLHVDLGCQPTWTCAPYQLPERPGFGDQIAWGESNAIVFANSVLGARTNRYGDFADLACAVVGRAPYHGLHTDEGRNASVVVEVNLTETARNTELVFPLLGLWLGSNCGTGIPLLTGLGADMSEDDLKSLGAAAASSGAVAMFHVLGVTPEATTIDEATGGADLDVLSVGDHDLAVIYEQLFTGGELGGVSVGTPHMSASELGRLASMVGSRISRVPFYLSTSRDVIASSDPEDLERLERFGVTFVTDTCTYITPILSDVDGPVMTNSGKWAYYAPGNLGVEVTFGSLEDCVDSAAAGYARFGNWPPE